MAEKRRKCECVPTDRVYKQPPKSSAVRQWFDWFWSLLVRRPTSSNSCDDIFAESADTQRQLYRQLAAQPIVEITGIVDASGVAGVWTRGDEATSLIASFDAWRVGKGPMRKDKLIVRRHVSDEELKSHQSLMKVETIIKIRGRVAEQNVFDRPEALLEEFIGIESSDAELRDYLEELKKPVVHQDEFFGLFTLDR